MSKNFDEKVRLRSEKTQEWVRGIRERLEGIAEGASSAPRLISSSAATFSRRNMCPGTHRTEGERRLFLPDLPERLR